MTAGITIRRATTLDADHIAVMVGELLHEIMTISGITTFHFNLADTKARLIDFISHEQYIVFIAQTAEAQPIGFLTLCEGYALYAEGSLGIIPELFVRPMFRSQQTGQLLLAQAKLFAQSRGWQRLEVTTPPLPSFEKTLAFYEREGFSITGGRKLKMLL